MENAVVNTSMMAIAGIQGFTAIAVGIILGLAAVGTGIGFGILGGVFWKAARVSRK